MAGALQAARLPFRWSQISFAYAGYFAEYRHAIEVEGPIAALTTFVGLHPPAYSLIFLALGSLSASPLAWHAVSGLFSVASVPLLYLASRRSLGLLAAAAAATTLAVSPHRNAYGLEVNNYPLFVAATAAQWWAFAHWTQRAEKHRAALALAATTALALYSHVLAIALPLAQGLALLFADRARLRSFLLVQCSAALLCLPLLPGVLGGAGGEPINEGMPLPDLLGHLARELPGRYGSTLGAWLVLALGVAGTYAARDQSTVTKKRPSSPEHADSSTPSEEPRRLLAGALFVHLAVTSGLLLILLSSGTASPQQYPYGLALLPTLVMTIGLAVSAWPRSAGGVLIAALLLHLGAQAADLRRAGAVWGNASQTHALAADAFKAWGAGSTLVLIQFPTAGDDDKGQLDPVYALLPWRWSVRHEDPQIEGVLPSDPFWGQPVGGEEGRWLYTMTTVEAWRLNRIATACKNRNEGFVVYAYGLQGSPDGQKKLSAWSQAAGLEGEWADGQALWTVKP